jgi:cytoskeletal protein CcmA (bactofilin family)
MIDPLGNRRSDLAAPAGVTVLPSTVRVLGEVTATGDLRIEGTIEGSVVADGRRLTIAPGARVSAAVRAGSVTVVGTLEGSVDADLVDIRTGALVTADVRAPRFSLADGATFSGGVNPPERSAADTSRSGEAARMTRIARAAS